MSIDNPTTMNLTELFARAFKHAKLHTLRPVYLESPYAGKGETAEARLQGTRRNIRYGRRCMRDCFIRGESPFASHLLYTQATVLDEDIPEERFIGIEAGFVFRPTCDMTVVYTDLGISRGMSEGISNAEIIGQRVEYRTLSADEMALID